MTKTKAASIASMLINLDYSPAIRKLPDGEYMITVDSSDGVLINTLKTFADNNTLTARARTVDYT